MKYKKYPSYKDSGIEWLGEIPNEWNLVKLKYLVSITTGNKDTENKEQDGKYPFFVRSKNVERINSYSYDGEAILTAGDGDIGKIFHYINGKFDYHQRVYMFYKFKNILVKFLYFYLQENLYKEVIKLSAKTTVDSLRLPMLQDFIISIPSIQEQQKITNFLDNATAKIDTLIKKQTKLIEILKEKRQAVISHTVTKGMNPDVKMKDSGVMWLGDIPEHWEMALLSTVFDNNKVKNKGMKNNNLLSLSYGNIVNKNIDTSFGLLPESFESYQIVKPGYIILRLTDLQNDKKSLRTGLVTQVGIITSAYVGLKKKSKSVGNEKFIHYYLHTFDIYKGFYGMGSGVRQSLNFDELKKLRFVLPPKQEQNDIVEYIEDKTSKMDKLIEKANKSIELLKEKRAALISAAVTGKIDVREEV